MKYRLTACLLAIACASAAPLASGENLTAKKIAELTAPAKSVPTRNVCVELSGFGRLLLPSPTLSGMMERVREFPYPTEFQPPYLSGKAVIPTVPTAFGKINVGWTIRLHAEFVGGVVALAGTAEYVEVNLVNGGYGALAGPVYDKSGHLLTRNILQDPLEHSTTSRFHVFAVPGDTCEILLYKGDKTEKHTIKVSLQ